MIAVFVLLIIYQVKHFLADYPLQNRYMLGKFRPYWNFLGPLSAHCMVHATMTLWIAAGYLWYKNGFTQFNVFPAYELALIDFVIHFIMDRIKAGPKYLGRFKAISADEYKEMTRAISMPGDHPEIVLHRNNSKRKFDQLMKSNTYFWWSLGLDQMVHHLTHYYIIWMLVS